jgi:hypothetical protein
MTTTKIQGKTTHLKLSEQVKETLFLKGYSFLFNDNDFKYYRMQAKYAFNKALTIAELFIQDNLNSQSDYNGYVF